ncbi:MAG: hypothetical protein HY457_02055 [Parcubacteria group bacterium]|nr:hypothetical protein [Parcubacteria group bacterium]
MDFLKKIFGRGQKDDTAQVRKEPQVNPDMNRVDTSVAEEAGPVSPEKHEHKEEADKNVCEFC